MSLIENVSKGIVDAMKSKDADVLGTLRMLKTALTMREVEKGRSLEPAEELQVVASLVKQRRDSIDQFTKGNRPDLADKRWGKKVYSYYEIEPYWGARPVAAGR